MAHRTRVRRRGAYRDPFARYRYGIVHRGQVRRALRALHALCRR